MEDSTMMTIEFLRARLQSERLVSRIAKQRADELSKRVVELEEQLKAVTLQRKKAEKATAEVLDILENHGVSDYSETFNSSSDQEGVLCVSKECNDSLKKKEGSMVLSLRGNEAEESFGLDFEGSHVPSRSSSCKSCTVSSNSRELKYMDQSRRRRSSFVSGGGYSSRKHLGKSCHQTKRRETRSEVDDVTKESLLLDAQEIGEATRSGEISNTFKDGSEILEEGPKNEEEKVILDCIVSGSVEDQIKVTNGCLCVNEIEQDTDLERALEQQAQLIGQYEAEENAQREWEEKFIENNSCTPDSCEQGNQSDITEEKNEIRAETAEPADFIPSHDQGAKSEVVDVSHGEDASAKTPPDRFLPTTHADMGCLQDQQCSTGSRSVVNGEFQAGFTFQSQEKPETNDGKQKQVWLDNNLLHPTSHGSPEHNPLRKLSSSHVGESFYRGESSGSQNEPQTVMLRETTNGLGSVLEALQRAKLSLKHELDQLPLSSQGGPMVRVTGTTVPAIAAGNAMEISVGHAGLLRVPADLKFEASPPQANLMGPFSEYGSSLTGIYPSMGVGGAAGDPYTTNSYLESGLRISRYAEPNLNMGVGLPASTRYTYPSYAGLVPKMPPGSGEGFPRLHTSMGPGMLAGDRYSDYYDQFRSNIRR